MFKNVLRDVVDNTEGAVASLLMGFDGIAVDTYHQDDMSPTIETIGMEYSTLLGQIRDAARVLEIGTAREVAVQTEAMTTVIRLLNEDYFVAVALKPGGNYGKARFHLRRMTPTLLEGLS